MKGFINATDPEKRKRYQAWMDENVPNDCQGRCRGYSDKMAEAFPELRVVGVFDPWGVSTNHAWCTNTEGGIIDPTAHQFEPGFLYPQNPAELSDFPKGKCPWCGELILPDTPYNKTRCCDESELGEHVVCNRRMDTELNSGRK